MEKTGQNSTLSYKKVTTLWSNFDTSKKQHWYILSLCIQFGWSKPHPTQSKDIADLEALDRWMRSAKCPVQKPLKSMTARETSKIITALESMVIKKHK